METVPYATSTTEILIASFTFTPSNLQERKNIFPDRVTFNASGTPQTYTTVAGPLNFPVWSDTYHSSAWELRASGNSFSPAAIAHPQALQITSPLGSLPAKTVFVSSTKITVPYEILLKAFTSEAGILTSSAVGVPASLGSPGIIRPHTALYSDGKLHFLFLSSADNRIHYRTYDGTILSPEISFLNSDVDMSFGLSGCVIKSGTDEYLAVTYARSSSEIGIVTFKSGQLSSPGTFTINIGNFDSPAVNITQNPRTGKILLMWQYLGVGYYLGGKFNSSGNFSIPLPPDPLAEKGSFGSNFDKTFGNSCMSYDNFENCFVLPTASGNAVKSYFLHGTSVTEGGNAGSLAHPAQFQCNFSETPYAGLIAIGSNYQTLYFYRRKLPFPEKSWWQNPEKILHLEGPPLPSTQVSIAIDFAEPKAENSLTRTVNAGPVGGLRSLTSGYRVIASSSNYFSLYFDKQMRVASFPELIGTNTPVILLNPLDPANPIDITHIASTANELLFKPAVDLLLNTTYQISIASSVIDNNGSQIYEGATFSFITQNSSSQVQADEINSISAYSAPGFTGNIASGSEVNASATIYLRVDCLDPAFNTIDTTSIDVVYDDAATPLSTITLTETAADSGIFDGSFTLTSTDSGKHVFKFKTLKSTVYHPVFVDFPAFSPGYPASAATEIPPNSTISINVSESIDPSLVNSTGVVLTLSGTPVLTSLNYNDATRQITITPTTPMTSEKTYFVTVKDQKDTSGNPQQQPLVYSFTIEDTTAPTVSSVSPADLATGVLINSLININFSENIAAASVDKNSIKLRRNGLNASYSISLSGSQITIDPDDTPEGYLQTGSNYSIEVNSGIRDLKGNTFSTTPFTSTFATIASQTTPGSIAGVALYADNTFSTPLLSGADYPGTGTLYIQFSGADGQALTVDSTIASISTGQTAVLTETASSSGVFRGSTSFSGLADRFNLKVQSTVSPSASAALLITWPALAPVSPASDAVDVSINAAITIIADESIDPAQVNAGNIILTLDGNPVTTTLAYNDTTKLITITPTAALSSQKVYLVTVNNQKDISGNPQLQPLVYSFTIEDKTAPTVTSVSPADLATGVLINSLININFSESITAASVDKNSIKLMRNGLNASYSLSISGSQITIDPDDTPEGYLQTGSNYSIEVNSGIRDLKGNAFSTTPFTSTFATIASQTTPGSIAGVALYADNTFSTPLLSGADYPGTGTLYIQFSGADGQSLTVDSTIASISTGQTAVLTETASSSGVFRGSTSFAGLTDRFNLKVQSTVSPSASAALLITWPALAPVSPASDAVDVSINAAITIIADESIDPAQVNAGNIILTLDGNPVTATLAYNDTTKFITITPSSALSSQKVYLVTVNNQKDISGNPQLQPLIYSFTIEDKTAPTVTSVSPADLATGVLINSLININFSENIAAASVDKNSIRLLRNGLNASYSLSLSGSQVTIDPDDTPESYLQTDSNYSIEVNSGILDLKGNAFSTTPFSSTFATIASTTTPISIGTVALYADSAFSIPLLEGSDYSGTGTLYFRLSGIDGQNLTRDTTIASISTGQSEVLFETASASGVFEGSTSFSSLGDRFKLKVQSTVNPAASASLLITWPMLQPLSPASGAINVPVNSTIIISADESLNPAEVNGSNISLSVDGVPAASSFSYNNLFKQITITPAALMSSEKTYTVTVSNQKDTWGNPQTGPLIYKFSIEDKTPPTITANFPANGATDVTIDRLLTISFSEAIAAGSINKSSVKLSRNGTPASYSLAIVSGQLVIDPDDIADNGMLTAANYQLEINSSVTDIAGNALLNVPEPFSLSFSTQPRFTPPLQVSNLSLYKDPLLITSWGFEESIPASAVVYIKAVGIDGATQTRDIATLSLSLSWGPNYDFAIEETASNSSGYYIGLISFASLPLYGIPAPQPAVSAGKLTFSNKYTPETAATLSLSFPDLTPGQTTLTSLAGTVLAADATNARIDTDITLTFSDELLNEGDAAAVTISSGTSTIFATRSLSADRRQITISPISALPFGSFITMSGVYSDSGLRSKVGNPLYRPFSFGFRTQANRTPPVTISSIRLFPDSDMSALSAYSEGQDFIASGSLYIEAIGQDAAPNTIDTTSVSLSNNNSVELSETSASSGVFHGSTNYTNLADGFVLRAVSQANPAASASLKLSIPALTLIEPASGASNVSLATTIVIKASEAVNPATISTSNCRLLIAGSEVEGSVSLFPDGVTIQFVPAQNLALGQNYTFVAAGIKDLAGNEVEAALIFNFTVQINEFKPISINSIKVFSDGDYVTQLGDGASVSPGAPIFIEISAIDASSVTIDTTRAGLTTSASGNTLSTSLIETSVNSGVFRGSVKIFPDENAVLTVFSETDKSKKTTIKTLQLPQYLAFQPASGTTSIYLDTVFTIDTNKALNSSSISSESIILAGSSGLASYIVVLSAPDKIIVSSELKPSELYYLKLTDHITDVDGLKLPETIARFNTLTPQLKRFRLFSDAAMQNELVSDSEVETGRVVYALLTAINTRLSNAETASATFSDGLATTTFLLAETEPGEFSGSFIAPDSPDRTLTIIPENTISLAARLKIVSGFSLISSSPASGAVNVPADVWPSWNFNRAIDKTDLTVTNFSLIRLKNMTTVPATIRSGVTGKNVWLEIGGSLPLLESFEMRLSGSVRDVSGNILDAPLVTRFTTQPPPPPPTEIVSLKNYETADYATTTIAVANNDSLYLELIAKDTSFSTYETARVRLESSDTALDGQEITLIEIAPPSGIYRLAIPLNVVPGTTIKIQSQADPTLSIDVTARVRTLLTSISPASGSSGLFLDEPISLTFSESVDPVSLNIGLTMSTVNEQSVPVSFKLADANRTVVITPAEAYVIGSQHRLGINTSLRDLNGLFLLPQTLEITTRSAASASLVLQTGIAPRDGQNVALTGEALRANIQISADTTDLFLAGNETRTVKFAAGNQSFDFSIPETAPGHFQAAGNLSVFTAEKASATLLFADNPVLEFSLATEPLLISVSPASSSINAGEFPDFAAAFSRKMAYESAENAMTIKIPGGLLPASRVGLATDSTLFNWQTQTALPVQASCSLRLTGLIDYLGQPLADYEHGFSTSGIQGLNVYSDSSFAQLIATSEISLSQLFVEIAASSTLNIASRSFYLGARRGTRATETVLLAVEPLTSQSGRFRCSLSILPGKGVPRHSISLFPGEWLELTSPELTSDS
ncbi:MAG: Ig-like domain-containing protein, partial [Candidatus Riflebacteria bacterium]|nr:Ig-like domain-containing protein [Candidatus Riflebacteria bacterium]